ncbi:MAG TPA: hypothetical protein VMX97_03940, partial [Hyphomicrobiaceae bacterium]|nr:hypothetical protein [Hyphomicrobiaceae bacterium]
FVRAVMDEEGMVNSGKAGRGVGIGAGGGEPSLISQGSRAVDEGWRSIREFGNTIAASGAEVFRMKLRYTLDAD